MSKYFVKQGPFDCTLEDKYNTPIRVAYGYHCVTRKDATGYRVPVKGLAASKNEAEVVAACNERNN